MTTILLYKQESYEIVGAAMHVYNTLGAGFLEAVYQEALEIELSKRRIPFEAQKELHIKYDDVILKQRNIGQTLFVTTRLSWKSRQFQILKKYIVVNSTIIYMPQAKN